MTSVVKIVISVIERILESDELSLVGGRRRLSDVEIGGWSINTFEIKHNDKEMTSSLRASKPSSITAGRKTAGTVTSEKY